MGFLMRRRLLFRDKDPSNSRAGVVSEDWGYKSSRLCGGPLESYPSQESFRACSFQGTVDDALGAPQTLIWTLAPPFTNKKKMFTKNYECMT
jgi:hypothetical protein